MRFTTRDRKNARNASTALLRAGTARMEAVPGPERWGDYNGLSRDPVSGDLVAVVDALRDAGYMVTTVELA